MIHEELEKKEWEKLPRIRPYVSRNLREEHSIWLNGFYPGGSATEWIGSAIEKGKKMVNLFLEMKWKKKKVYEVERE